MKLAHEDQLVCHPGLEEGATMEITADILIPLNQMIVETENFVDTGHSADSAILKFVSFKMNATTFPASMSI